MNSIVKIGIVCLVGAICLTAFIPAARSSDSDFEQGAQLLEKALALYKQGKYHEARSPAEEALAIIEREAGPSHAAVAVVLNNLGNILIKTGQYRQADPVLRRALSILNDSYGPESPEVIACLGNLAALSFQLGDYRASAALFQKIMDYQLAVTGDDHPDLASTLGALARAQIALGQLNLAEPLLHESLSLRILYFGAKSLEAARSLHDLAGLHRLRFEDKKAEALLENVLSIRGEHLGPNHPDVAATLNDLAILQRLKGNFDLAEGLYSKALKILEAALGPDHPETGSAVSNLGTLHRQLGDPLKAESLYRRAIAIWETALGTKHPQTAVGFNHLGGLYLELDRWNQAVDMLNRAMNVRKQALGPDHYLVAETLINLASLADRKGEAARAEALLKDAMRILEKHYGRDHHETAAALSNLALLAYKQGEYRQALNMLDRVLATRERRLGPWHPLTATALSNRVLMAAALDRFDEAFEAGRRAQEIDQGLIDQVIGFGSEAMKGAFFETRRIDLDIFLGLISQYFASDPEAVKTGLNAWLQRKGMILEAQRSFQEALTRSQDPECIQTAERLAEVRQNLSRLTFSPVQTIQKEVFQETLDRLNQEKEQLESRLARLSKKYSQRKTVWSADCESVAKKLRPGEVLLEFVRVRSISFRPTAGQSPVRPDRYLVFILHPDAKARVTLIDLGPAAEINRRIDQFKKAMEDDRDAEGLVVRTVARKLYNLVFAPIRPKLDGGRRIFISPDSLLNLTPFEVFMSPDGRWLLEDYELSYLAAGRDLLAGEAVEPPTEPPILIGNPQYDLEDKNKKAAIRRLGLPEKQWPTRRIHPIRPRAFVFHPLPGSEAEVKAIAALLAHDGCRVFFGEEALEEVLLSADSPLLAHMATHGFFLDDPGENRSDPARRLDLGTNWVTGGSPVSRYENPFLRSGLALAGANHGPGGEVEAASDGLLTAEKVLSLDLNGTRLVTLSACETGLGATRSGQGVYGLRRAFLQTGAQGLVMSMWSVPDRETQELMVRFYRYMVEDQIRIGTALRLAALEERDIVRARYGSDHPRYWGAFIFLGSPDLTISRD